MGVRERKREKMMIIIRNHITAMAFEAEEQRAYTGKLIAVVQQHFGDYYLFRKDC